MSGLLKKWFLPVLFLAAAPIPGGMGAEEAGSMDGQAVFAQAVLEENMANAKLTIDLGQWDAEKIRELGRSITALPPNIAAAVLWLAVSAPSSVDATPIMVGALSAPSPGIRRQAVDIFLSRESSDSRRFILNRLTVEHDDAVLIHIIDGMARLSSKTAVTYLIDAMHQRAMKPEAVAAAAAHLRRLTRTNLPDSQEAWQDWWFDHSYLY